MLNQTFIPRGLRTYLGTLPVAAKLAADQSRVQITFTFPESFIYLLKGFNFRFTSDDQVNDFESVGSMLYSKPSTDPQVEIVSSGTEFRGAALTASKNFQLAVGAPRYLIDSGLGDDLRISVADVSSDASTAGDVAWYAEFFAFDREQVLEYPVNTCVPTFLC